MVKATASNGSRPAYPKNEIFSDGTDVTSRQVAQVSQLENGLQSKLGGCVK